LSLLGKAGPARIDIVVSGRALFARAARAFRPKRHGVLRGGKRASKKSATAREAGL